MKKDRRIRVWWKESALKRECERESKKIESYRENGEKETKHEKKRLSVRKIEKA